MPDEPTVLLSFAAREPVGKNATFARGKGRRLYKRPEAAEFVKRIVETALFERATSAWPRDPWIPAKVCVTTQIYNTRHDADAVQAAVRDALQGILYADDKIVANGPNEPPLTDDKGRRVEIIVELWALRDVDNARKRREASERRRAQLVARRGA